MFRELLVSHSKSLEFRAELIVLMVMSDNKVSECEQKVIAEISKKIYADDSDRARILDETIHEFREKIISHNGLDYSDLINKINNDIKRRPSLAKKINISSLRGFYACTKDKDERIFYDRIIEFLENLKKESNGKL